MFIFKDKFLIKYVFIYINGESIQLTLIIDLSCKA